MLSSLVDDGARQKLHRIELADREPIEPSLVTAGQAVNPCPPHVPKFDIHTVRPALAKEQNRHSWRV